MVEVAEDDKRKRKKGKRERRRKSPLNPRLPILQPMSLPLNYAYVFIIAISNLIFNDGCDCGCAHYAYYRFYVRSQREPQY